MKGVKILLIGLAVVGVARAFSVSDDEERHMHPTVDDYGPREMHPRVNLTNEQSTAYWQGLGKDLVKKHLQQLVNNRTAKNVIFFLGDGMGVTTVSAARVYLGQLARESGEESQLAWETFPAVGLSKTYCVDRQVADSACTSTAYLCGVKTNYNTVGVNAKVSRGNCTASKDRNTHVDSFLKRAIDKRKSAGIVTTTRVTHASPAGAYAHSAHRDWENDAAVKAAGHSTTDCPDIADQLIQSSPGKDFKVILGGGRREMLPTTVVDEENYRGYRTDRRNLIDEWKQLRTQAGHRHEYVWNKDQLKAVSSSTDYLLGLFEGSHLQYTLGSNKNLEPTFEEMVEAAIKVLSKDANGYVLFAEGGNIDHAHHSNYARLSLDETVEFHKGVAKAVSMTSSSDTLIVVTADHSHVLAYAGYPTRGNGILAANDRNAGSDGIPYTTLSYANGNGYRPEVNGKRVDVTKENMASTSFRYPAMVPLSSETHGGEDVAVYARGPMQHLFTGNYEQSSIPHFIEYAACLVDDFSSCT